MTLGSMFIGAKKTLIKKAESSSEEDSSDEEAKATIKKGTLFALLTFH